MLKTLAASKKGTVFFFGGYGLPVGKFGFTINSPKKLVKVLLAVLYDSWYRDTICLFASIINREEFYNVISTLLKMTSASYSHDSVLFDSIIHNMCRERRSHVSESELFHYIQEQLSTKTRMDLLLGGSVHVNGKIRQLSKRLILLYENMLDYDMIIDFLVQAASTTTGQPVIIDSACVELMLKKMSPTQLERYTKRIVELFWESQHISTEAPSDRRSAWNLKQRIRTHLINIMRALRYITDRSNDDLRTKVLIRAKQILQDTALHSTDASVDNLCTEASLLLINWFTSQDALTITREEITIQVLKTMFFSSQVNRIEAKVKHVVGTHLRQHVLRELRDRDFLTETICPDLLATVIHNLEQAYNLTGLLMPALANKCNQVETIVKLFMETKISDTCSIARDFWMKLLDAIFTLVCEEHPAVQFLQPSEEEQEQQPPNDQKSPRDEAIFKLVLLFEFGEWLIRDKVVQLLVKICQTGGREKQLMTYLIRKMTCFEHIYSDQEEENHQIILNTAANCIELWSIFCSHEFDFQNMPLPGIIVLTPQQNSQRTLNSLPFLYHCLKNHKFDVRREAVKAIVRCLYSGALVYDEEQKQLIAPWINAFNKKFVELMITDKNTSVIVEAVKALPQLLSFGDHYGENNISCYKVCFLFDHVY
jgi:hypothetical protein